MSGDDPKPWRSRFPDTTITPPTAREPAPVRAAKPAADDVDMLWAALLEIEAQGCPNCAGIAATVLDQIRRRTP